MPLALFLFVLNVQHALNDTIPHTKQSIIYLKKAPIPTPTNQLMLVIPSPTQGFFCNFEDQIQRKKVPIDFGLKLK